MGKKTNNYSLKLGDKIDMVKQSIRAVTRGYKTSRLVTGTAGIGKSYAILEELEAEKVPYIKITGGVKDVGALYSTLCDHNEKDKIIFFDDTNQILKDRDCIELMRAATENIAVRPISYANNKIVRGRRFYAPRTEFVSKIIIATNIKKFKVDPGIVSRTSAIEIMATVEEIFEWVGENLKKAPPYDMPIEWKQEVYNFIKNEIGIHTIKQFDFRTFEDSMLWYGSSIKTDGLDQRGDKNIIVDDKWKSCVYTLYN
ncbi:MAG: hypothetical protein BWY04_01372 [candidate division CPR1 bacterium ADurb.Bin160]|uniref:Uncharacterized protein n=1 Tax=candidate division CPR1 bacterium ADurb.Bin160 TaxID=1852826 RepID=A0A1V5ZJD7_9BACT|nr:MAG: hypothetical protein BWY04_01372 [candidate division CPR1 bacterium ADurb.Bin160]